MARPKSSIPQLRFHKHTRSYYAFADGKRHYFGRDKREAERRYRRWLAAPAGAVPAAQSPAADGLTLAEALLAFRRHAETAVQDRSTLLRIDRAVAAAADWFGKELAARFRAKMFRDFRARLLRLAPPLSRRYVNHLCGSIKAAFTWLVAEELVPADSLPSIRAVRALGPGDGGVELPPVPPVEDVVVDATKPLLPGMVAAMVELQRLAGCRPGEVCRMKRGEVSTRPDEAVPIAGAGRSTAALAVGDVSVWMYAPSRHKTLRRGKLRVIPVGPAAQKILAPMLEGLAPDDYVFRPIAAMVGERGKGCVHPGSCYTEPAYCRAVRRAIERHNRRVLEKGDALLAGKLLPEWSPLQLRHAAAENAANKADADGAAAMLGHSASRRALDVYVQATIVKAAEVAAKVG
jgi:integrase